MTDKEKEQNTRDLLLQEVEMLDGMITEVEDQHSQVTESLLKLKVVREALKHVVGEQKELDLDM
jgi:hypothetical protein|tara:strand:+ start:100 stop:291 length:192 start_codon:yes stop_codon:yes gene_type:complete